MKKLIQRDKVLEELYNGIFFLDKDSVSAEDDIIHEQEGKLFTLQLKITNTEEERSLKSFVENGMITFVFNNFNDSVGAGTSNVSVVAKLNGKPLYAQLWCYKLGSKENPIYKIECSFYREFIKED